MKNTEVHIFDTSEDDLVFKLTGLDPVVKAKLTDGPHTFSVTFERKVDGSVEVHHIQLHRSGPFPFTQIPRV